MRYATGAARDWACAREWPGPRLVQSAGGFPLGLARRSREKHALMNDTQDLDDAVRRDAIDQQMAGAAHPLIWRHQTPRRSEMVGADTRNPRDFARACCPGVVTHDGQRGEYQVVITPCSLHAPLALRRAMFAL